MQDYYAEGRRIGIGITVVALLALLGAHYWSPNPNAARQEPESPAEVTCLKRLKSGAITRLNAAIQLQMAHSRVEVEAAASNGGSQPANDAAKAKSDYSETVDEIQRNTEYCSGYAKCFPTKPFKAVFDACYSVMADKTDQDFAPDTGSSAE